MVYENGNVAASQVFLSCKLADGVSPLMTNLEDLSSFAIIHVGLKCNASNPDNLLGLFWAVPFFLDFIFLS